MATKKRGPGRPPKAKAKAAPAVSHTVPAGFWSQVVAIFVIIFALLLTVGMFGGGGMAAVYVAKGFRMVVGWTTYLCPLMLIYLAVQVFRDKSKRPSSVVLAASGLATILLTAFFQLFLAHPELLSRSDPVAGGGVIGWLVADLTLRMVNVPVAALIYVFLLLVLAMFIFSVSPKAVVHKLEAMTAKDDDAARNAQVADKLAQAAKPNLAVVGMTKDEPKGKDKDAKSSPLASLLHHKDKSDAPDKDKDSVKDKSAPEVEVKRPAKLDKVESAPVVVSNSNWHLPDIKLLSDKQGEPDPGDTTRNAEIICDTLNEFGISGRVDHVTLGPRVAQYCIKPQRGVKLSRITELENSFRLNLAVPSIRIEAPIPGQPFVGIEIPNRRPAFVGIRSVLQSSAWRNSKAPLSFAVGLDVSGNPIVMDLASLPHLLIAGTTGSGKSVMMNAIIVSLLYRNTPDDLKFVLVDPKGNEMIQYNDMPHLLAPIVAGTSPEELHKLTRTLLWLADEMERRYGLFAERGGIKKLKDFNAKFPEEKMPSLVLIVDEYTDLIDSLKSQERETVTTMIQRIAQKGRAAGIHEIIMMQAPRAKYIQGPLKANVPAGFAFAVRSKMESQQIINASGAEGLMGKGDMLMITNSLKEPRRVQAVNVEDDEIDRIVADLKLQSPAQYNEALLAKLADNSVSNGGSVEDGLGSDDDDFRRAVEVVINAGKASTSLLQRRMRIGYGKASRLIDEMEDRGVISAPDGSRPREVLISSLDELNG